MYDESLRASKRSLVTEDGSMTLFSEEFAEPYHSDRDGALNESLQKHVKPAISLKKNNQTITILDMCFGLGYNTLATLHYLKSLQLERQVHIISPEFDRSLIESLGAFTYPAEFDFLKPIIEKLSRDFVYRDEQLYIEIVIGDAREILPTLKTKFDIIYQDAFSPTHNPLLWTSEYFAELRSLIKDDGVLTTYSTAATVRMGLDENGFKLFNYKGDKIRASMVASPKMLRSELEFIDMELKKIRNPDAKSMRDAEYQKESNVTSNLP